MKDLIAKLKSEANVALGAIWLHIDAREKRIAELEAQIAAASAPAVDQHPNELRAWLSKLEDEVMPLHSDAKKLFTRVRTYLQACGYFKKPQPADTDKLRELRARIYEMKEAAYTYGDNSKEAVCVALDGVLDEIDEVSSTALQAPVREVPKVNDAKYIEAEKAIGKIIFERYPRIKGAHCASITIGILEYMGLRHSALNYDQQENVDE